MERVAFFIVYPLIWFISKLPFFLLHILSDFLYLLLFYFIRYRKEVVLNNLKLAFPDKDILELKKIRKKFYKHFTDIFIEMIKSFTISEKELDNRFRYVNKEIFEHIESLNRSVILMGSHYANWEWIINIQSITKIKCFGAYTRISNFYFDKMVQTNRSRFGSVFIPTSDILKKLVENKQNNINSVYGLLSDQSPQLHKTHYWSSFFNMNIPIHTGAEMLAKKYNFVVVYMSISKIKRSQYEIFFEILTENPRDFKDYGITDIFLEKVERQIREKPEYYLWSHRRFKHLGKFKKEL